MSLDHAAIDLAIKPISLQDYAELQTRFGTKVIRKNGQYWRQIRPFFYRPLLPVEAQSSTDRHSPVSWPSGFQYVLPDGDQANSTMNFIMLENLANYSLTSLTHKRRQMITRAAQQFQVRPIRDPQELKEKGHRVYLSFQQRTQYNYKTNRTNRAVFDQWVDNLFWNPNAILLGGYGPDGLAAISNSYWVNHTLVYSTLICETESMKKNLGELMFHVIRELAGRQPGLQEIYVRSYQGGNSLDQYYLLRGCQLIRKPARLEISPAIRSLVRWVSPRQFKQLCGDH